MSKLLQANKRKQKAFLALKRGRTEEAIRLLTQACKSLPRDADAWYRLGTLYGQQGNLPAALDCARRAVAIDPKHADAHCVIGNVLASQGKHQEAMTHYRRALERKPHDPALLLNYGTALFLAGEHEQAAEYLLEAAKYRSDDATVHNNLGNVFKALNEHQKAIIHYEKALKLKPELVEAHLNLGDILISRLGHPQAAEFHYRQATALQPDNLQAIAGLVNTLRYQGRLDEALSLIQECRKRMPDEAGLQAAEADILERKGKKQEAYRVAQAILESGQHLPMAVDVLLRTCDIEDDCAQAIRSAETLLESGNLKVTDAQMLHFSLGRRYDKLEQYEQAFRNFRAGNECLDIPWDATSLEHEIDALIDTYTQDFMAEKKGGGHTSERPIFILGMPRSGTSLTEQILASHPRVAGAGELNTLNDLVGSLHKRFSVAVKYPEAIHSLNDNQLLSLANAYLEVTEAYASEEAHVTDKMPHNFKHIGLIHLLFPKASIVHCIRDPRDTCLSIYFQNFGWIHPYGTRLEWLGAYYRQYVRLMKHWQSLGISMFIIQYEQLVENQEKVTRDLLDFCGLEWNDACLEFHTQKRHVATASYDQVRQKLYRRSKARWLRYEKHLGPLLDALGDADALNQELHGSI